MSTDIEDLRRHERASRSAKIYSSPGMEQLRQAEGGLKNTPGAEMAIRHADARGEMQTRHAAESRQLHSKHEAERNQHLSRSTPVPGDIDRRHKAEREALHAKHARERTELKDKHLIERSKLREAQHGH